ncbi:MAG: coproporphyrinogen III oxidase [Myxococcales bacterium]|nr:coproporphyrinogen III oxidase [Myxococcales bacterium]
MTETLNSPSPSGTSRLRTMLAGSPYQAYVYAYPHKTAYRTFAEPLALDALWSEQDRSALYLYVHIPFCEMRCGFCNLFTSVKPGGDFVEEYLEALRRQVGVVSAAMGEGARFARFAMGGGTPTQLPLEGLEAVLDLLHDELGAELAAIPASVECSPETATLEKLRLLRERGVDRISMGVQSFVDAEVKAIHRPQNMGSVRAALERMNALGFPHVNIDLMYGLPEQTPESWLYSIQEALAFNPAEIFLYPLYVRPLTRMGSSASEWDDERLRLYRLGRDMLVAAGYEARSMRLFRRRDLGASRAPAYSNLTDGMVGLGCGARSYTERVHYSSAYAVGPRRVKQIIRDYITATDADFAEARYGFTFDDRELRRRHVALALLSEEGCARGLDLTGYRGRFGTEALEDLPELLELVTLELAAVEQGIMRLTARGVERSDVLGPWLFSAEVEALMNEYTTT